MAACASDSVDVPVIGAAAAAQDCDLAMPADEALIFGAQLNRIAGIEIRCGIQFRMAPLRGIRAQAVQPLEPRPALRQHIGKMGGMRTVDHVIGGRIAGRPPSWGNLARYLLMSSLRLGVPDFFVGAAKAPQHASTRETGQLFDKRS